MFCLDWLHAGRATRGKPRRDRHRCRSWPTLGLLACIALLQSGCQSGPLAHCGDGSKLFGPCGFFSRVSDRMFTRTNQAGCCQPGVVGETTIVDGVPGAVVTPGVVSPSYSSGTQRVIVPPGSTDSSTELSPANPVDPTARSKVVSPPPGNGASRSGTGPQGASYQTRQDSGARLARRRTESNIKTTVTTSEPTAGSPGGRSARGKAQRQIRRHQAGPEERDARRSGERARPDLDQPSRARARNLRERRAGAHPLRRRRPQARRRQPPLDRRPRLAGREGLSHPARSARILGSSTRLHHGSDQTRFALRRTAHRPRVDRSRTRRTICL
jgi:hypothetical protein